MKYTEFDFECAVLNWLRGHDEMRGLNGLTVTEDDIKHPYYNDELERWECDAYDAKFGYVIYMDNDGNIQKEKDGRTGFKCEEWYVDARKIKIIHAAGYGNAEKEYDRGNIDVLDRRDYDPKDWDGWFAENYDTITGEYVIVSAH